MMNPTEAERLLQECIDGTASPGERARLESWLAENQEGRTRRAELEALFAELASVHPVGPPTELRQRVLAEIAARATRPSAAGGVSRPAKPGAKRFAFLRGRPVALAGAAFSAGLVIGSLLLGANSRWPAPGGGDARVSGAMGGATPVRIEAVVVRLGDAHVMARAWDDGGSCQVQLELLLPAGASAELTGATGGRDAVLVRRVAGAPGPVHIESGRVSWGETAAANYRVALRSAPGVAAPLRLTLISADGRSEADLPVSLPTRR